MDPSELLLLPQLSVMARRADSELSRIHDIVRAKVLIDGRADVEELLGRMLAAGGPSTPKTLDLVGHSTPGKSLLAIGDWVIDIANPTVCAFFRGLADQDVLRRLEIRALRLLGCQTADTRAARTTICRLAEVLGVDVYGTTQLIYSAHYHAAGFRRECEHVLVCSRDLQREIGGPDPTVAVTRYPRVLDIETLPCAPLIVREHPWPRRIANLEVAVSIIQLVRRAEGAEMPGLLATPSCEVALPATRKGWYHRAQVLLDGDFLRVYPDGDRKPGVVFPVDDPHALRALVDDLPPG
jgi:hypothetical protein